MTKFNTFNAAISGKTATPITPVTHASRGKYSVGIVCSAKNGKRVTFTSALSERLKLKDSIYVTAYTDDGFIVIGATPYNEQSSEFKLSGENKKISYSAELVHFLIEAFNLDYSNCVSKSYGDIVFNNDPNSPMAILNFPVTVSSVDENTEVENEADNDGDS